MIDPLSELLTACIALLLLSASVVAQENSSAHKVRVPATVEAFESADLFAKVGGYLKSISVDIGDEVAADASLAIIDAPELEKKLLQKQKQFVLAEAQVAQSVAHVEEIKAQLDSLSASVTEAKTEKSQKRALVAYERNEYQRISNLSAQGAIQSELLDSARYKLAAAESELGAVDARVATATANLSGGKAAVRRAKADVVATEAMADVAKADIELAERMVEYLTIRAPWPGKVTSRMFDPGAFIQSADGNSAAEPIIRLVRDDKVRVAFSLSQKDIAGLKKGVSVTLSDIDALQGETFKGTISRFSGELDPKTRMLRVEMDLDNADKKLRVGFFGYVTVEFE